jgi:hypothetical protein
MQFLTSFTFKIAVTKEANRNQKQDKTIKRIAGLFTTKIGVKNTFGRSNILIIL